MGLSNNYNFKNWIDLAANEGKINDGIFAFDLRNTEQITYFYIGSNSFPPIIVAHFFIRVIVFFFEMSITVPQYVSGSFDIS